ncbi:MAG: hypothetical protein CVU56_02315 [Deltaproteobacteria bacterium HGW-Deltaproteobacteria-14]|jgi:hypothetical protein|nr:MAG: hypothetical protein CVU56_02315 [Deltaproteobacteria bacterium HGW-Deltaproteobacteria-14]
MSARATGKPPREGASVWRYLKEAFLYHWNLLAFGGGTAAAIIAGSGGVALPLVIAGELIYLGGLVGNDRFRSAIDARVHAEEAPPPSDAARPNRQESVAALLQGLDVGGRARFLDLRARCRDMGAIASGVSGRVGASKGIDRGTLDRLLWAFLRLLYSKRALAEFLATTDKDEIAEQLERLRLRETKAAEDQDERILKSLRDSVATGELRLSNYEQAEKNAEFVDIELDRIDGKIRALTELAVSTEDPDYISSQVDSVAESMASTERAIREIQHLTGIDDGAADAPAIMDLELEEVVEA